MTGEEFNARLMEVAALQGTLSATLGEARHEAAARLAILDGYARELEDAVALSGSEDGSTLRRAALQTLDLDARVRGFLEARA